MSSKESWENCCEDLCNNVKDPYLIQTGRNTSNKTLDGSTEINSFVALEYRGAAEFEFGALPKSTRHMIENLDGYVITKFTIQYKVVTGRDSVLVRVLHRKGLEESIEEILNNLSKESYRLKEPAKFLSHHNRTDYSRVDFWWDIESHWVASTSKKCILNFKKRLEFLSKENKSP